MTHRDRSAAFNTCPCGQPARDATICRRCTRTLTRRIGDFPSLADDLTTTMRRLDNTTNRNDGGKAQSEPLPINLAAAKCLQDLRGLLARWCRVLNDDHQMRWPRNTVAAAAAHVASHTDTLRKRIDAQQLADQVARMQERATKLVDQPENLARITVGPCPVDLPIDEDQHGGTVPCPGEVTAVVPAQSEVAPRMECSSCGQVWSSIEWNRMGRRIQTRAAVLLAQKVMAKAMLRGKQPDRRVRPMIVDCPGCARKDVHRVRRACPECGVILLHPGELEPVRDLDRMLDPDEPVRIPAMFLWRAARWVQLRAETMSDQGGRIGA